MEKISTFKAKRENLKTLGWKFKILTFGYWGIKKKSKDFGEEVQIRKNVKLLIQDLTPHPLQLLTFPSPHFSP